MNETAGQSGSGAAGSVNDLDDSALGKFRDPDDAKPWQRMIDDAAKVFQPWNDCCDNIDKQYASLKTLRERRDREFQIFWANLETLRPSIYARPPQPVVVPKFKDRRALPREASEVLERALVANGELDNVHRHYLLARDDLARNGRGALWARYDIRNGYEYACLERINRKDFLHDPARCWSEVQWVARRAWLTLDEGVTRFGEAFRELHRSATKTDKPSEYTFDKKAEVWEIWHRTFGVVCWISPGHDKVLDLAEPHLNFDNFFPCPEPAYGTREPDSLVPVPDYLYYKDQIEEINLLTRRISALTEGLRLKGLYPAGVEDISKAVEKALKSTSDNVLMVPVTNLGTLGPNGMKGLIEWIPIDIVAVTIKELIALRRQLIEDVYQITGISDIMRGSTAASETATAQQLKSQYGSVRVRERQAEMIRLCRDGTALQGEIIAEQFQPETLQQMTQSELPTAAAIQQQLMLVQEAAQRLPAEQQAAVQKQIAELQQQVTFDQVVELLKSDRLRPFILDIETDSTIQPDEDAEKQRRTEFVTVLGQLLSQALPLLQAAPEAADFVGEVLRFGTAPFRAGRSMEGAIDDLVEQIKEKAAQPAPPSPEQIKAEQDQKDAELKGQIEQMKAGHQAQMQQADAKARQAEAAARERELALKEQMAARQAAHDKHMASMDERLKTMDVYIAELKVQMQESAKAAAERAANREEMENEEETEDA